ncbi:PaaX family transcriptional regulator [Jatrophihabitans cynanchi]|uniref:PaaX family transcriptional regulator n=1 Tax=Jatrophihabitans cynanchi TaxID=2944128 RepID=A0ABY7JXZ0_9ACTN|nr:PaaX family transcriptional regulator C-terminal domain-containing protein [Jatrophihabitans sp. SB3-54]WAX55761.1 PaaX family transcriptional regulator [Jatrophihabitans sp. SB3-54]
MSVEADSAPSLSRRHAAGAESARGLLFTVLGELVLPHGGVAWTSALIDVLGRLGVEEKASRQAVMRTGADGWLTSERIGRRSRWRLTARAEQLLTEGAGRIYGFTGATPDWDGQWVLVLARVAESDRAARHLLRTRMRWAGFGNPVPGVWISTHAERAAEAEAVLAQSAAFEDARVFVARHRGGGDLESFVAQAWDLPAIEQSYREFLASFAAASAADPLPRLVDLVHAWRAFPWRDPGLPRELLPARWSGQRAAALFARRHAAWSARAQQDWLRLNAG